MALPPPFLLVAGARPNFMKVGPICKELTRKKIPYRLLNTGQHHDPSLSSVFLKELGLPQPHFNLEVGSGSHAQTTARVMERAEPILLKLKPRAVIVVGDVTSTLAIALAASKLHVPIAHVEAGLRSFDRSMPEEINRILTDRLSDLLLTPSPDADQHLLSEGTPKSKIKRVGNVMIDSLMNTLVRLPKTRPVKYDYFLMTFHRPSNVDSKSGLLKLIQFLHQAAALRPIFLPLHPRTRTALQHFKLTQTIASIPHLTLMKPLSYSSFIHRMLHAQAIVTDSGGIQEETSHLGIPCLILRTTTERPICITRGTSELMGDDFHSTLTRLQSILNGKVKKPQSIPLWDGKAARRIVKTLLSRF